MKMIRSFLILALFAATITSCSKDEETETLLGNWVKLSDVPGSARAFAVSFTIEGHGYIGGGIDADNNILNDFWKYDPERNNWEQIADFPGEPRYRAVAFALKGKGYVGTGFNGVNRLKDLWCYDPDTDSWEQKTDFPGTARYGAVAMSIDTTGYVGTGFDGSYLKDFWAYYPESDTWEQKDYVSGSKRMYAVAFVLNGKGYICTGINSGVYEDDLLEYDPSTGLWSEKRRIADVSDDDYDDAYTIIRSNAVAFVIGSKAYITTGTTTSIKTDTWEYDPFTDTWEARTSFEGTARTDAVAFSVSTPSKAFVVTGKSGNYRLEDIWEFKPNDEYNVLD
ncbi:MAG: galactose oxidase [Bacteroidales bacterium]|nr:galactose oxidase [Bacteroidales bacterium]